ncbi:hypothetical protein [uncultured Aquimarina sp.]|uniref:hypothetical protein n=1 Tax=uncultured Aquimarina sp. TaxID=575652 RepID=UPI002605AE0A|nr:hypothetical protein [uncultured Aquimarina sp.]
MKKSILFTALMLVGTLSFAGNSLPSSESSLDFDECTVSTTETVEAGDQSHTITVTNTASTCFGAWSANQDEIKQFKEGVQPAE